MSLFNFLIAVILSLVPFIASADTPTLINYQGNLSDISGTPVADGPYSITFTIYDGTVNPVWTETQNVHTSGGTFAVLLGSTTPISDTVFNDPLRYLGIKVGADPELTPLTRLVTVPYSFRTSTLDGTTGGSIEGELDLTNNDVTADTVFGYQSQVDNGNGSSVGGFFSSGAKDTYYNSTIGVFGKAQSTGDEIRPTGVLGIGINDHSSGWSIGGRFEGKTGIEVEAISRGINNRVIPDLTACSSCGYGLYNNIQGSGAYPVYGTKSIVTGDGADAYGFYSSPITTSPGRDFGLFVKLYSFYGAVKYGTYVEGAGASSHSIYGHYNDIKRENSGTTYGAYNYVNLLNGGSGTGYAAFNYAKKEASSGSGTLYGTLSRAWNYNTSNTSNMYGVYASGYSAGASGTVYGLYAYAQGGSANYAVYANGASGPNNFGIYATAPGGYAGYFNGLIFALSASGALGSMILDHPLDPENKTLQHSNVVSPDMKTVYDGNITLDANGEAYVILPDYFEALNMEFRYQITAIGVPGPNLFISEPIFNNTFTIAGGTPQSQVSWQVTGIRQDAYANQNRVQVETNKKAHEVGLYITPEAHGQPPEKGIHYVDPKDAAQQEEAKQK